MRQSINPQMQLGEVDISAITFNLKSKDDSYGRPPPTAQRPNLVRPEQPSRAGCSRFALSPQKSSSFLTQETRDFPAFINDEMTLPNSQVPLFIALLI